MPAGPTEPTHCDTIRLFSSGAPAELDRRGVLHALVDRDGLDVEDLDLGDEQVREDHHVRRALDQDLLGGLTVPFAHRGDVFGHPLLGGAEPAHRFGELAELRTQVVLAVAVAQVAGHRGGGVAVERSDRASGHAEDRAVHELRVIAVGLVLRQQLPVGPRLVLQPAGGQFDPSLRRQTAPAGRSRRPRHRDAPRSEGPSSAKLPKTKPW